MLFLGHIGITAVVSSMLYLPILAGTVGVLLPDLVDKALVILGYAPCSRFIGHTIFFPPLAGIVTYIITRNKKIAIAVTLGAYLHLLEDLHDQVPLLYPFKTYAFFNTCAGIKVIFSQYIIATEAVGGLLLIAMSMFKSQFASIRKTIWSYLKNLIW